MCIFTEKLFDMMYPVLGLLAVSVVSFVLQLKNNHRFIDLVNFLLFLAIGAILLVKVPNEESSVLWTLTSVVSLNFILSHVTLLRRQFVRALVPLISLIALIVMLDGQTVSYIHESGVLINKFFILAGALAVIGYELAVFKSKMAAKLFGLTIDDELIRALFILFMGAAIFFGGFQSGSIGLYTITALLLSASFYRDNKHKEAVVSLLPLVIVPVLMYRSAMSEVDITEFDVLEGLFYGAFGMYFIQKLWDVQKRNLFITVFAYAISLGFAALLLFLGSQFLKMGGMDAVIGAIVGASLINLIVGSGYTGASFIPLLIVTGFALPRFLPASEEQEQILIEINNEEQTNSENIVALAAMTGKYSVDNTNSKVTFVMGEKGETKGAFRSFEGEIIIDEDVTNSTFEIKLNTKDITTFNDIRDESVLSDEYLNEEKYPSMTFRGEKLIALSETEWEIQGEFTMLGVSKPMIVTVQGVTSGDQKLIIGKGEIDRRDFGMAPSSSEGNIVTFEYRAVLK